MRVLAHIKRLDDCFGQFLVSVRCLASHRTRVSGAPGRLVNGAREALPENALLAVWEEGYRSGCDCEAQAVVGVEESALNSADAAFL